MVVPNVGLFGKPGSGKTTLFHLLTRSHGEKLTTAVDIRAAHASVSVPEPRLDVVFDAFKPKKKVYPTLDITDVVGYPVRGGETKITRAIADTLRKCDALALVLAAYTPEARKTLDRDYDDLTTEIEISDLATCEHALDNLKHQLRLNRKEDKVRYDLLDHLKSSLDAGTALRKMRLSYDEEALVRDMAFLSLKPMLIVVNCSEDRLGKDPDEPTRAFLKRCEREEVPASIFSAKIEDELADLPEEDRAEFVDMYKVATDPTGRFATAVYAAMDLVTFLTVAPAEARAWTIKSGTTAVQAAGLIHTDIAKGFVRAETVSFSEFDKARDMNVLKKEGRVRLEGRDYVVKDGDLIQIRFTK
jgi:hypothetical protein